MTARTTGRPKPKLARTDYTICVCTNDRHDVNAHRTPARPVKPTAALLATYPTGHVVEHHITWTPWKVAA